MNKAQLERMIKLNLKRKSGCRNFDLRLDGSSLGISFFVQGFYQGEKDQKVSFDMSFYHEDSQSNKDTCDLYVRTKPNPDHGDVLLTLDYSQMRLLREYLDMRINQIERSLQSPEAPKDLGRGLCCNEEISNG